MIKPEELRIGNVYSRKHGKGHTDCMINGELLAAIYDNNNFRYALNDFENIPITGPRLFDAGFTAHHDGFYNDLIMLKKIPDSDGYTYKLYPAELGSAFEVKKSKNLLYMHQLQNIESALRGIEFPIDCPIHIPIEMDNNGFTELERYFHSQNHPNLRYKVTTYNDPDIGFCKDYVFEIFKKPSFLGFFRQSRWEETIQTNSFNLGLDFSNHLLSK